MTKINIIKDYRTSILTRKAFINNSIYRYKLIYEHWIDKFLTRIDAELPRYSNKIEIAYFNYMKIFK
jgi:hypothetical protein